MSTKRFQSKALQHVFEQIVGDDPEKIAAFEQEQDDVLTQMEASQLLYEMRTAAGLSQRELAKRVGTTASVICRMEDADYDGHTLAMLRGIAHALGRRIELRAVPVTKAS